MKRKRMFLFQILPIIIWSLGSSATTIIFPDNFDWCMSTAAHQFEGNNINSDLYQWETSAPDRVISKELLSDPAADAILKNNSGAFATAAIQCPKNNPADFPDPKSQHTIAFSKTDQRCEYSGIAADHWNRVQEDADLLQKLNVKSYRFSVEWAKIEPTEGVFDEAALTHYKMEISELRRRGINPHVTLFHFSMPNWLRQQGGWDNEASVEKFRRFTTHVYQALGDRVSVWYTLNEPLVHLTAGYVAGVLPPGLHNPLKLKDALTNILKAHAASYQTLHSLAKASGREVQVGIAHHLRIFDPLPDATNGKTNQVSQFAAEKADEFWNWTIVDAIETGVIKVQLWPLVDVVINVPGLKGTQDFFGLNYYTRDMIGVSPNMDIKKILNLAVNPQAVAAGHINDMGWEIYPEGMYRILVALDKRVQSKGQRKIPVMISENGIPDKKDDKRISFITQHLLYVKKAMTEGVQVKGYCYWSLTDNFEWNSGYYPRFGLYSIDYSNLQRTARPSALWFADLAKTNQLQGDIKK